MKLFAQRKRGAFRHQKEEKYMKKKNTQNVGRFVFPNNDAVVMKLGLCLESKRFGGTLFSVTLFSCCTKMPLK